MGGWWIFLMIHLSTILKDQLPNLESPYNIYRMLTWEGISFFVLLTLLSITVIYLFIRDLGKSKSMQNFFGLMAHEIKNPLAAIQVQAEALIDEKNPIKIETLANRLKNSTQTFSKFINNVLQLSSIEMGDRIHLTSIPLMRFLQSVMNLIPKGLTGKIITDSLEELSNIDELHILGDTRALEIIFSNLITNILNHSKNAKECKIIIIQNNTRQLTLQVLDDGEGISETNFLLLHQNIKNRNFSKKNGFGLYLVTRLMELQKGSITFKRENSILVSELIFSIQDPAEEMSRK